MTEGPLVEKTAVLHVHTDASDGTGSPEKVIETAAALGVDILGINDHRTLEVRDRGYGGWHSSLFVLAGSELEDDGENSHILAYGIDRLPGTSITQEQIDFVNSEGGIAIAAHPEEAPGRLPKTRRYSWKAGAVKGLAGVEVWNYMSLWKKGISILDFARRLRRPDDYVEHPNPAAVEFWEKIGGCAIACPDAHALKFGIGSIGMEIFPYEMLFKRLRTHILLPGELSADEVEAEEQILRALRSGSCFTSNLLLGDARGFRAWREDGDLILELPAEGEIVVSGSGNALWSGTLMEGRQMIRDIPEGRISVSIFREGRTWIYCAIQ